MSREKSASYTGNGAAEATAITGRVTSGVRPAMTSSRSMLAPHSRTGAATDQSFARSISPDNSQRERGTLCPQRVDASKPFRCAVFSIEIGEPCFLLLLVIGEGKLVV